jgi:hypothetical protein
MLGFKQCANASPESHADQREGVQNERLGLAALSVPPVRVEEPMGLPHAGSTRMSAMEEFG